MFLVVDRVNPFGPEPEPEAEAPALAGGGEIIQEGVEAAVDAHEGQGDPPHFVDQAGKRLILDDLDSH